THHTPYRRVRSSPSHGTRLYSQITPCQVGVITGRECRSPNDVRREYFLTYCPLRAVVARRGCVVRGPSCGRVLAGNVESAVRCGVMFPRRKRSVSSPFPALAASSHPG